MNIRASGKIPFRKNVKFLRNLISENLILLKPIPDKPNALILDVVTQAGTYIKELVHGEFGRTEPSIQSIIGQPVDIISLDVLAIDLDWPPEIIEQNEIVSK